MTFQIPPSLADSWVAKSASYGEKPESNKTMTNMTTFCSQKVIFGETCCRSELRTVCFLDIWHLVLLLQLPSLCSAAGASASAATGVFSMWWLEWW